MVAPPTKSSTRPPSEAAARNAAKRPKPPKTDQRRLSEVARHLVIPDGIVSTGWPAVEQRITEWGDSLDVWQAGLGRVILGKRADGMYACTIGGVVLSIPRQVAKTFIVSRILFALATLFPGMKIIWTAHRVSTTTNTFNNLRRFAKRKRVAPYIASIRATNGEQEIVFTNGSAIRFGAREAGFGRGWDEVDVEVFDEAQILTVKAIEDLVAATNQTRHPHGALIFYMGTPPRPTDPGEVFTEHRDEALELKAAHGAKDFGDPVVSGDTVFVECSADENVGKPGGPELTNRNQWKIANPAYPLRVPETSMLRLRKHLKSDDSWRREALGVWDLVTSTKSLIGRDEWNARRVESAPLPIHVVYGVKYATDGTRVALSVAVQPEPDGPVHVEVVKVALMSEGDGWLVDWLVERAGVTSGVVIDGKAGAGPLVAALRARKFPARLILLPTVDQVITAHAEILQAVRTGALTHFGQPGLDGAVYGATKRDIGKAGGWGWEPIGDDVDVTPLEAVTYAHFGAKTMRRRRTTASRSGQGRKVVVLS